MINYVCNKACLENVIGSILWMHKFSAAFALEELIFSMYQGGSFTIIQIHFSWQALNCLLNVNGPSLTNIYWIPLWTVS